MDADLLAWRSESELAATDPVEMNLLVAKGIPALAGLEIPPYQRQVDEWATEIKRRLPNLERHFHRTPGDWDHDINLFRLGVVCQFVDKDLGIRYKEEQKYVAKWTYADPGDLFLNGVIDTRRGTCGNMTALHVALGWRLGWPVSIAMAGWHEVLRFDDGKAVWNVEASNTEGGFRTNPDGFYQQEHNIPQEYIDGGSDLTFLRPRQLLGKTFGLRGRYWYDRLPGRAEDRGRVRRLRPAGPARL
jgi:hypothetical protein